MTNSWTASKSEPAGDGLARINVTLLNRFPVSDSEVQPGGDPVCSGAHPNGSWATTPNVKPISMVAIGGTMYAAVQCQTYADNADPSYPGCQLGLFSWIVSSTDGVVWNRSTPYTFFTGRLANPLFIQAGRAMGKAPDNYLYAHFPASADLNRSCMYGNDYIILGRVPRAQLLDRKAYEFWSSGTEATGPNGRWAREYEEGWDV